MTQVPVSPRAQPGRVHGVDTRVDGLPTLTGRARQHTAASATLAYAPQFEISLGPTSKARSAPVRGALCAPPDCAPDQAPALVCTTRTAPGPV